MELHLWYAAIQLVVMSGNKIASINRRLFLANVINTGLLTLTRDVQFVVVQFFFFEAHNGGRVFFDPPLGPPWNKHPCTTREPDRANGNIQQPLDNLNYYDTSINVESYTFSLFPRPKGTIVTIYGEEEALTFITPLKLNKKLLDRVWVTKNEDDKIVGLSFLTIDFEPIEVPARLRKEASNLSLRQRKELSQQLSYKINDVATRIKGKFGDVVLGETNYGSFGVIKNDTSTIFILPVPINHFNHIDYDDRDYLRRYMIEAANSAINKYNSKISSHFNSMFVETIIFLVDDVVGYFSDSLADGFGFYDDNVNDGSCYDYDFKINKVRMKWVDTLEDNPIELPDSSIRLEEVFNDEADYCTNLWPGDASGRWVKVQLMIKKMGYSEIFQEITFTLKKLGWRMSFGNKYYDGFTHEIEYLQPDKSTDDDDAIKVRFLFSRSNSDLG